MIEELLQWSNLDLALGIFVGLMGMWLMWLLFTLDVRNAVYCTRCKSTDLEKTPCEEMIGVVPVHSDLYECKCGTTFWLYRGLEKE